MRGFVCVYDGRRARLGKRLSLERYLAHEHVLVSYNGDLRGIVEDVLGVQRRVRISVPTFAHVGPALDGTALLATVPEIVARELLARRSFLRKAALPFELRGTPLELIHREAQSDDDALGFVRSRIRDIAKRHASVRKSGARDA